MGHNYINMIFFSLRYLNILYGVHGVYFILYNEENDCWKSDDCVAFLFSDLHVANTICGTNFSHKMSLKLTKIIDL